MIEDILRDAVRCRAIRGWNFERWMLFPDAFNIVFNDGSAKRYSIERTIDFCVGFCQGRGEIPDPAKPLYA